MKNGFKNVNVVLEDKVIKGSLSFEGDRILSFEDPENVILEGEDVYVCPGFIDEHIHGANGSDVMDASKSSLENMAKSLLQEGVTSFLATTMTESKEKILASCRTVNLEGPFISLLHPGAQDPHYILKPDVALLDEFVKASGNNVRLITFAYENDENSQFLEYCLKNNITPSIGHSDCKSALFKEGIAKGLSCVTHLLNAQRGFHHREVGISGEALLQDGVNVELICDTYHVCKDALSLAFKDKKKNEILMITDSCEAK